MKWWEMFFRTYKPESKCKHYYGGHIDDWAESYGFMVLGTEHCTHCGHPRDLNE